MDLFGKALREIGGASVACSRTGARCPCHADLPRTIGRGGVTVSYAIA